MEILIDDAIEQIKQDIDKDYIDVDEKEGIIKKILTDKNIDEKYKEEVEKKVSLAFNVCDSLIRFKEQDSALYAYEKSEKKTFKKYYKIIEERYGEDAAKKLDDETNEIIKELPRPNLPNRFQIKGQVMGQVQSGKTTLLAGLINKCFDVGYEVVIVIAGRMEILRNQAQQRIDNDCVKIYEDDIIRFTKAGSDIKKTTVSHIGVKGSKIIGVCKRHSSKKGNGVIELIQKYITNEGESKSLDRPTIVIADESDDATIDTSKNRIGTANNIATRKLLDAIDKVCYIGFSATPIANIYTDYNNIDDLFPSNFIKYFEPSKTYVGAKHFFGEKPYPYVEIVIDDEQDVISLFNEESKDEESKDEELEIDSIPKLKEAINNFIIVGAIRCLRGYGDRHNSMLINIDRRRDPHDGIKKVVDKYLEEIKAEFNSNTVSSFFKQELKAIYENICTTTKDIEKLDKEYGINFAYKVDFDFEDDILNEIKLYLNKLETRVVNGRSKEYLNYDEKENNGGLHVIAIGSDMFGRGYTLNGLTITYLLRTSYNWDTLLQSGRFFSHYEENYRDLVRLYTSQNALNNFKIANELNNSLIKQVQEMNRDNKSPIEFGIFMERLKNNLSDREIMPSGKERIRDAKSICLHTGIRSKFLQMSSFYEDDTINDKNIQSLIDLISNIEKDEYANTVEVKRTEDVTIYRCNKDQILNKYITDFFKKIRFPKNTKLMIELEKSEFDGDFKLMIESLLQEINIFNIVLLGTKRSQEQIITSQTSIRVVKRKSFQRENEGDMNVIKMNDAQALMYKDLEKLLETSEYVKDTAEQFKIECNNNKEGYILIYIQDKDEITYKDGNNPSSNLLLFTLIFPGKNDKKEVTANSVLYEIENCIENIKGRI